MRNIRRKILSAFVAIALTISLAGCGVVGLFDTQQMVDMETSPTGQRMFPDTPKNWEYTKRILDSGIDAEARGEKPFRVYGGSWRSLWKGRFQTARKYEANPNRTINYIIQTRRAHGLPEL